jgi:glycosyltransferase involved in cell wall biosynthesis
MEKRKYDLIVVVPLYNDEESLHQLIADISKYAPVPKDNVCIFVVDDASIPSTNLIETHGLAVEIVSLVRNVGHQRAIAIGLSYAVQEVEAKYVLVMDSDGEDQPRDIAKLLNAAKETGQLIFASRAKRWEGIFFKFLYACYKQLFNILTGTQISFGNFCLMPFQHAQKLIYVSEIWIHFSGGILKSKLPYSSIRTEKGKRYAGTSKMNFQSLILHGLSSLAVQIETVAVRLLITSVFLILVSTALIFIVVGIKFLTTWALPGWTSTMLTGLTLIFLQALLFSILLVFIILSYRTQKSFIPAIDHRTFIHHCQVVK